MELARDPLVMYTGWTVNVHPFAEDIALARTGKAC